ncbi:hypothetical protein GIB67_018915, partial [Kingdonia uniflora]
MKEEIEQKRVVDEQYALEFADLLRQLDVKCKEIESLKVVNALLMEQIDLQLPPATHLVVLQSYQPVPDTTLAKKYEDLFAVHEDVKKKLIAKEDFRQKLVNAEEMMKSLEANNSKWARKRSTTSNKERFQNLLMDTSKYWWFGLGVDNHYVRLFPRYFDLMLRNFKALLREHNVKRYRVNDMAVV